MKLRKINIMNMLTKKMSLKFTYYQVSRVKDAKQIVVFSKRKKYKILSPVKKIERIKQVVLIIQLDKNLLDNYLTNLLRQMTLTYSI